MKSFFSLHYKDHSCKARAGILHTDHGKIETPVFMPVGTQGTVKAVPPKDLLECGTQIMLGNAYHLYLRPGDDVIKKAGGLHKFISWSKPVLTDSGGYQVFSLADLRNISEEGVKFQSHLDGSYHLFTPEKVMEIEMNLGADIMMVLDECTPYPCSYDYAAQSKQLTSKWAKRCKDYVRQHDPVHSYEQFLFGIVQGSTYKDLRKQSIEQLLKIGFDGYAIGGLAVGEPKQLLYEISDYCSNFLPESQPRYLMGVGKPEDIVEAIGMGIDMFDCVLPTRNGRNGTVFTWDGRLVIKNASFKEDFRPIDESCPCYACRNFSRAYLRHLFQADELLVLNLASLHNLYFYLELVKTARQAIIQNRFNTWRKQFYQRYQESNID